MKKLKLVAVLAILALTIATFVTMFAMPASAAAVTDAGTDTKVYTGYANDTAAINAGMIGRFGDAQGTTVEYVKSLAGLLTEMNASNADLSASRLGSDNAHLKFNLLVDLTTATRLRFYNYDGSKIRTTAAVFDGNGHTITSTSTSAQHFKGTVTVKNLTITGAVDYLVQIADNGVVLGSGVTISNTKANGLPIIITGGMTLTVDGATVTGTVNNTNGVIVPWGNGCTINVKSGKVVNNSTDAEHGAAALSFARESMTGTTFNISGGTIEAIRPINFPSSDQKTNKLNISGGTITCKDSTGTNDNYCILFSNDTTNAVVNITGGTFNGEGTFAAVAGTNNTINISGSAVINTARESRGFIQTTTGTNNTVNISGGTVNSVGYGFVANATNLKVNISGGTLKAVANNFFHFGDGSGSVVKITGNPTIICGNSTTDHTKALVSPSVTGVDVTIAGGTIYCGHVYQTAASTDAVVSITGGTIYCENALYSTSASATGALNISGGTVNCTNAALWVTSGAATLNVYDGADINTKYLGSVRSYKAADTTAGTAEEPASTGIMNLNVFGGDVTCTDGDILFLYLNQSNNTSYKSNVNIYGGNLTTTRRIIQGWNGGGGTINFYGGTFTASLTDDHPINIMTDSYMTLNIWGGTFKTCYDSTDDGKDTNITTGTIYMSAGNAHANIYGGRFYILDDINDITKTSSTGAHLVPWAGAKENMNFYGGEFFGGTHVYHKLAWTGTLVNEEAAINTVNKEFLASPTTKDGASIRLAADSMGIRFESSITKAVLDYANTLGTVTGYGTIITPRDFGLALGANLLNSTANYVKIKATSNGTTTDANGNVTYRAALTNIQTANIGREFVACAYIDIQLADGTTVTLYANDKVVRSIDEVAKKALADYKTEDNITEAEKATYCYMTTIYYDEENEAMVTAATTPVYTRYNNAQISAIKKCTVS